jgi:malonyl-CoA O-methyltransferase
MPPSFDKKNLGKSFANGAKNYDEAALVQSLAAKELCKIAAPFLFEGALVLDLGSGTGFISQNLLDKNLKIFEVDLALEMLQKNQQKTFKIQADFENLPFKNNSFDLVISSFSLQWINDFEKSFWQFFDILKSNGKFIFCLPVEPSLNELKAANIFEFNQLPKISELQKTLKNCGFKQIFFNEKIFKQNFANGVAAIKSLKKIGANHVASNRQTINKAKLKNFNDFCLKNFCGKNKNLAISWRAAFFVLTK